MHTRHVIPVGDECTDQHEDSKNSGNRSRDGLLGSTEGLPGEVTECAEDDEKNGTDVSELFHGDRRESLVLGRRDCNWYREIELPGGDYFLWLEHLRKPVSQFPPRTDVSQRPASSVFAKGQGDKSEIPFRIGCSKIGPRYIGGSFVADELRAFTETGEASLC